MHVHADSQFSDAEAFRILVAALNDPDCRGTLQLERAKAIGRTNALCRWSLESPHGSMHRVAIVRVIDGETMGFCCSYGDEADAIAVWEHIAETYDAERA